MAFGYNQAMKELPKTPPVSARAIALDILERVLEQKRALEEVFEKHPDLGALENRDRQFVRALVAATLRHLARIDRMLAHCLEHPLPLKAHQAENVLRLGAAQLLVLGTPAHAAVDSSVALIAGLGGVAGRRSEPPRLALAILVGSLRRGGRAAHRRSSAQRAAARFLGEASGGS